MKLNLLNSLLIIGAILNLIAYAFSGKKIV